MCSGRSYLMRKKKYKHRLSLIFAFPAHYSSRFFGMNYRPSMESRCKKYLESFKIKSNHLHKLWKKCNFFFFKILILKKAIILMKKRFINFFFFNFFNPKKQSIFVRNIGIGVVGHLALFFVLGLPF